MTEEIERHFKRFGIPLSKIEEWREIIESDWRLQNAKSASNFRSRDVSEVSEAMHTFATTTGKGVDALKRTNSTLVK